MSTGVETRFVNRLDPDPRSRQPSMTVPHIHQPTTLAEWLRAEPLVRWPAEAAEAATRARPLLTATPAKQTFGFFHRNLVMEYPHERAVADGVNVPTTLIFAKDDCHAEDVVDVVREEFGRANDFCQKITYRVSGAKPQDLIQAFRNQFDPRIAVTVDMIARTRARAGADHRGIGSAQYSPTQRLGRTSRPRVPLQTPSSVHPQMGLRGQAR